MFRALIAILFIAPSVYGVCPLNVRFADNPPRIVWDNITGAKGYQVQESFDDFLTSRNYFPTEGPFLIHRRVSADTAASYTVTVLVPGNILSFGGSTEACTEQITVTLKADPEFRALTRKAVVPIVGSGPGANGGRFKTSIRLTATQPLKGRMIFHPAGAVASPTDPSISYAVDREAEANYEDVVAAMGRSGIGSLDIVPDEGSPSIVPNVEARLYNDTPGGTFGFTAPALLPFDFLHAPSMILRVPAADAQFRVNAGLRTLTDAKATALIYGVDGRLRDFHDLAWPADYTAFGTISQLVGVDLKPGEMLSLFFDGAVIPFYTRTENRTNDPELFIPPRANAMNVGSFIE